MGVGILNRLIIIYQLGALLVIDRTASYNEGIMVEDGISVLTALSLSGFVDKTQLVIDFIAKDELHAVYLIAPRRFGKTFHINMLETILGAQIKENSTNFNEDVKNIKDGLLRKAEPKLKVVEDADFYKKNFANFIVFHLDFQILGNNQHSLDGFKKECFDVCYHQAYNTYTNWWIYFLKPKLSNNVAYTMEYELLSELFEKRYPKNHARSLRCLIKNLKNELNKEVILIIDEFDSPFLNILKDTKDAKLAELALRHISQIFGPLLKMSSRNPKNSDPTDRRFIYKTIFTGISELPIGPGSSQLNNVKILKFTDTQNLFSHYYGFTEEEVDNLLKKHKMEEHSENVKLYYDGYSDMLNYQLFEIQ